MVLRDCLLMTILARRRTGTEPSQHPGPGPGHVTGTQHSYLATSSPTMGWEGVLPRTPTLRGEKGEWGTESTGRGGLVTGGEDEFVMIYFIQ